MIGQQWGKDQDQISCKSMVESIYGIGKYFNFKCEDSNFSEKQQITMHKSIILNPINKKYSPSFNILTKNKRIVRKILYSRKKTQKYLEVTNGRKQQTCQLNINFKTIICNYFKDKIILKQLSKTNILKVVQFKKRSPSFDSIKKLCQSDDQNDQIMPHISQFVNSSLIIQSILKSQANLANKISMIKYLQILRMNIKSKKKIIKWKSTNKLIVDQK